jgi:hypothetical protein
MMHLVVERKIQGFYESIHLQNLKLEGGMGI